MFFGNSVMDAMQNFFKGKFGGTIGIQNSVDKKLFIHFIHMLMKL